MCALHALCPSAASAVLTNLFEQGQVVRDPGRQRWHDAILQAQEPSQSSCATRRLCSCRVGHGQLWSRVHGEAVCLLEAMVRNCTLTDVVNADKQMLLEPRFCTSMRLRECYLRPLSTCMGAHAGELIISKWPHYHDEHEENGAAQKGMLMLSQYYSPHSFPDALLLQRWGVRGQLVVMSELLGFLLRPREGVAAMVANISEHLSLGDCRGCIPLRESLAVHARHGDKPGITNHSLDSNAHLKLVEHLTNIYGLRAVHVMSDDASVVSRFGEQLERSTRGRVRVAALPESWQVYTGQTDLSAGEVVKSSSANTVDQLALFLAECILMAQSIVLVGPQVSIELNRDRSSQRSGARWPHTHARARTHWLFCNKAKTHAKEASAITWNRGATSIAVLLS